MASLFQIRRALGQGVVLAAASAACGIVEDGNTPASGDGGAANTGGASAGGPNTGGVGAGGTANTGGEAGGKSDFDGVPSAELEPYPLEELVCTGEFVEYHGKHYDFDRLMVRPAPSEPVPIYVGGMSDAALRRAARHDGWISDLISTDAAAGYRQSIEDERERLGRTDVEFTMVCSLDDAWTIDDYRRAEDVGVTDVLTMPWLFHGGFKQDLRGKLDGLHRFADEILPAFAED